MAGPESSSARATGGSTNGAAFEDLEASSARTAAASAPLGMIPQSRYASERHGHGEARKRQGRCLSACQAVWVPMPQPYSGGRHGGGSAGSTPGSRPGASVAGWPVRLSRHAGSPRTKELTMATSQPVPPAGRTLDFAVHAVEVTKTYGDGPTAVTARSSDWPPPGRWPPGRRW